MLSNHRLYTVGSFLMSRKPLHGCLNLYNSNIVSIETAADVARLKKSNWFCPSKLSICWLFCQGGKGDFHSHINQTATKGTPDHSPALLQ